MNHEWACKIWWMGDNIWMNNIIGIINWFEAYWKSHESSEKGNSADANLKSCGRVLTNLRLIWTSYFLFSYTNILKQLLCWLDVIYSIPLIRYILSVSLLDQTTRLLEFMNLTLEGSLVLVLLMGRAIKHIWILGKCPWLHHRQNPCLPALRKITTTLFFSQYCKFMCTILYYYDQSFMSLSHPKKKVFFFIHLKSKEKFSAISEENIFKIMNDWS